MNSDDDVRQKTGSTHGMSDNHIDGQLAVGVPTYTRVDRLERFLTSIPPLADRVYVADNGPSIPAKTALYERESDWPFELTVLDLPENAGLGPCRNRIVEETSESFLLMADNDHELTPRVGILRDILAADADLGGVAGSIIEPEHGRVWQSAKDFEKREGELVRSANIETKTIRRVSGYPFVAFDFIPYPTLYRTACVQEYSWDPEYPLGRAHVDFYYGHYVETDWTFGITPSVYSYHYPGGTDDYEAERRDDAKLRAARQHFIDKWGLTVSGRKQYWYDTAKVV